MWACWAYKKELPSHEWKFFDFSKNAACEVVAHPDAGSASKFVDQVDSSSSSSEDESETQSSDDEPASKRVCMNLSMKCLLHSRPTLSMVWCRVQTPSSLLMAIPFGSQPAERFLTPTGCSSVGNHPLTDIYAVVRHVLDLGSVVLEKRLRCTACAEDFHEYCLFSHA